jgi:hypothetical protein
MINRALTKVTAGLTCMFGPLALRSAQAGPTTITVDSTPVWTATIAKKCALFQSMLVALGIVLSCGNALGGPIVTDGEILVDPQVFVQGTSTGTAVAGP